MTVRVLFGPVSGLAAELDQTGPTRAFVVSTPGRAAEVRALVQSLGSRVVGLHTHAQPHVPEDAVDRAERELSAAGPDVVVAIGGGSAIGLAKALALRAPVMIAAVPTTYSGSEMTSIWGTTRGGRKVTGRDDRVRPRLVVYDARLTISLPPGVSAASGMNAMAHAVEAMYASDATPDVMAQAAEAAHLLGTGLPDVVDRPADLEARARVLRGAHLAGAALGAAAMGLHHRLCHVLGGTFGLPHARTHALLLPHVAAFNAPAAPDAMRRVGTALGVGDAAAGLAHLNRRLGITGGLAALGLQASDVPAAAAEATASEYPNPRQATAADVEALLRAAL